MRRSLFAILLLLLAVHAPAAARAQSNRYLEAGIPAADRDWGGEDYERAARIFSEGKIALPRLADPQGAQLLRRMTSTANFSLHHNKSVPLQGRLQDYLKLYQGTNTLLRLYLAEPAIGGGPHQEIAAVVAFLLQGSALGIELMDELLPTIAKDDQYATRMAGLKQMHSGLTSVFVGVEQMLGDQRILSADDRSVILAAMESTLPRIKEAFSPEYRIELKKKLEEDKARFDKPEDAARLSSMLREISL
jgi:hypothetical protein